MSRTFLRLQLLLTLSLCSCVTTISKDEATRQLLALDKNRLASVQTIWIHPPTETGPAIEDTAQEPIRVRYRHEGKANSDRAPIVLLHGTPQALFVWNGIIDGSAGTPGLAKDHEVIAVDLIGHGMTDASPPYTWNRMVRFVAVFLKSIDVNRATLVGNSYGGEIAWRTAVEFPELVNRLVLIGSSGYRRCTSEKSALDHILSAPLLGELASHLAWKPVIRMGLEDAFEDSNVVTDDLVEERYILLRTAGNHRALRSMTRIETGAHEELIGRIRHPTLIIWGEDDPLFGADRHARRFDQDIPVSRLVIVPQSGHSVQLENPNRVIEEIRSFLAWTPPSPPTRLRGAPKARQEVLHRLPVPPAFLPETGLDRDKLAGSWLAKFRIPDFSNPDLVFSIRGTEGNWVQGEFSFSSVYHLDPAGAPRGPIVGAYNARRKRLRLSLLLSEDLVMELDLGVRDGQLHGTATVGGVLGTIYAVPYHP